MNYFKSILIGILVSGITACFPGGFIDKGGYTHQLRMVAAATPIGKSNYYVLCKDKAEIRRRKALTSEELQSLGPPVKQIKSSDYLGGCEQIGQTSVFFLFNLWPVTKPLNPDYAMGTVTQELEGDTMIHLRTWHETHYYSVLGHVVVMKVKGDVIRYLNSEEQQALDKKKRRARRRGRK